MLNLSRPGTVVLLTLASGVLLLPFAWISLCFAAAVRPGAGLGLDFVSSDASMVLVTPILLILGVLVVPILLHEAIHGICFWIYTRDRPRFAFKGYAASAGAPEWHLPRGQYLVVGLAPMVVLTVLGLSLLAIAPEAYLGVIVLTIALHGAGCIGDVVSIVWLLRQPAKAYFRDSGDVLSVYPPLAPSDEA